ncbi:hypothetical protein QN277_006457 [Acacia crassicarpa]|uniref:Uncharacterized protein n=1 Tax=Acacia crassicarpa TaxID=499986 RepID=A0AAE1ISG3_9FABA|nr:hypothetical protein QN277_006457 [Acacia crassicarpa]
MEEGYGEGGEDGLKIVSDVEAWWWKVGLFPVLGFSPLLPFDAVSGWWLLLLSSMGIGWGGSHCRKEEGRRLS